MKKTKLVKPALSEAHLLILRGLDAGTDHFATNNLMDELWRRNLIKRRSFGGIELTPLGKKMIA